MLTQILLNVLDTTGNLLKSNSSLDDSLINYEQLSTYSCISLKSGLTVHVHAQQIFRPA